MAEANVVAGSRGELAFEITWSESVAAGSAADATLGRMCVYVCGQLTWGDSDASGAQGLEWPWVELLEHLATAWRYMVWEEIDPLGLGGEPETLRDRAEARWIGMAEADAEREDELLRGFERTHDLSAALKGAWPPSVWVLRVGEQGKVAAPGIRVTAPWKSILDTLTQLGDAIGERLAGLRDERAVLALHAWEKRRDVDGAGDPSRTPRLHVVP